MTMLLSLICVLAMVAGCEVVTARYCLPTETQYAREESICGLTQCGIARIPLGGSSATVVGLRPADGRVALEIQMAPPVGTRVRFPDPEPVEMPVLKFPSMEVNDEPVDGMTIPVRLVERTGLASCRAA